VGLRADHPPLFGRRIKNIGSLSRNKEQVPLYRRAKIDLLVGNVAVEIKAKGSFGDDDKKYSGYLDEVRKKGWVLLSDWE